jgi:hypothetical protein
MLRWPMLVAALVLAGCPAEVPSPADASDDAALDGAAPPDSGFPDAEPPDAAARDAAVLDAALSDAPPADAHSVDAASSDAAVPAAPFAWVRRFGGPFYDRASATVVTAGGNVVVAGWFYGHADLGAGEVAGAGSEDGFVTMLSPDGATLWVATLGGPGADRAEALAVEPSGDVIVVGSFQDTMPVGAGALASAGDRDAFVVRLSGSSGAPGWSARLGGADDDIARAVAIDSDGDIVVAGDFQGTADFGAGPVTSLGGRTDVFLKVFTAAGAHVRADKRGGEWSYDHVHSVAIDTDHDVLLGVTYDGPTDFGLGTESASGLTGGIGRYDEAGTPQFFHELGGYGDNLTVAAVAPDGLGHVLAAGDATMFIAEYGLPDALLTKVDTFGNRVWVREYGGSGNDRARALALDPFKFAIIGGSFSAEADFGIGTETSAGSRDAFLAKVNASGTTVWRLAMGGPLAEEIDAVAAPDTATIYAAGTFEGTSNIGITLGSAGATDVFVVKVEP